MMIMDETSESKIKTESNPQLNVLLYKKQYAFP